MLSFATLELVRGWPLSQRVPARPAVERKPAVHRPLSSGIVSFRSHSASAGEVSAEVQLGGSSAGGTPSRAGVRPPKNSSEWARAVAASPTQAESLPLTETLLLPCSWARNRPSAHASACRASLSPTDGSTSASLFAQTGSRHKLRRALFMLSRPPTRAGSATRPRLPPARPSTTRAPTAALSPHRRRTLSVCRAAGLNCPVLADSFPRLLHFPPSGNWYLSLRRRRGGSPPRTPYAGNQPCPAASPSPTSTVRRNRLIINHKKERKKNFLRAVEWETGTQKPHQVLRWANNTF